MIKGRRSQGNGDYRNGEGESREKGITVKGSQIKGRGY